MSVTFPGRVRNIVFFAFIILCAGYGCNDNAGKASNAVSSDTTRPQTPVAADSAELHTTPDTTMPTRESGGDTTRGIGVVNPRPNVNR